MKLMICERPSVGFFYTLHRSVMLKRRAVFGRRRPDAWVRDAGLKTFFRWLKRLGVFFIADKFIYKISQLR